MMYMYLIYTNLRFTSTVVVVVDTAGGGGPDPCDDTDAGGAGGAIDWRLGHLLSCVLEECVTVAVVAVLALYVERCEP